MLRLLLIPLLVWVLAGQPLVMMTMLATAPPPAPTAACGMASCCTVVETTTCCGDRLVERVCGMTGGECRCGVQPADADPAPEAPLPQETSDLVLVLLGHAPRVVTALEAAPPAIARASEPRPRTTHNEARALLGVWHT